MHRKKLVASIALAVTFVALGGTRASAGGWCCGYAAYSYYAAPACGYGNAGPYRAYDAPTWGYRASYYAAPAYGYYYAAPTYRTTDYARYYGGYFYPSGGYGWGWRRW